MSCGEVEDRACKPDGRAGIPECGREAGSEERGGERRGPLESRDRLGDEVPAPEQERGEPVRQRGRVVRRERLQAGGHVHPVAVDVVAVDDHLSEIHADPEQQPGLFRVAGAQGGRRALDAERAVDGGDDAVEAREHRVTGVVHDPAARVHHAIGEQL